VVLLVVALGLAATISVTPDLQDALREGARLEAAGDTGAAAEKYRQARDQAPAGSVQRARALDALSALEARLGQYASALLHANEAASIYAKFEDRAREASALNRVGRAAFYAGKYADAAHAFQSAVRLSSLSGDREGQAEQLGNLGTVLLARGRYSDALRTFDDALAVVATTADADWARRRRRIVLGNKATLLRRLGRHQQALAVYRELGIERDVRQEEQALLLVNLGVLYRRLGDPIKALENYDAALKLFARNRHVQGELNAMTNRGILLALDLARLDDAERSFSEVIDLAGRAGNRRELLVTRLYRGETLLRAGARERAQIDFAASLVLARELQAPEEEWMALYGLARITEGTGAATEYLTQALSVIERIREQIAAPSLRSDFFADKREVYDALIAARLDNASPAEAFALFERAHSRTWRERLGLSASVDLTAVQRALPEGVLLLDYWNSPQGSALAVVTRTRAEIQRVPVNDGELKVLIDGVASGPEEEWRRQAQKIAADVLPPAEWLREVQHVIVVADGALALVPFELLPVENRLLIERAAVSYTPTAAMLLRAAPPTPAWSPPWRLQLRAFADPVFASASLDDAQTLRPRLGSSAKEVRDAASEIGGAAIMRLGAENQKAYLYESRDRAPILHLATHAMADANEMEQSRIVFSPSPGSGSEADYLFLREAYDLPLTGVELAVLSACDTERGRVVRGEGVQSFSRAFLAAGARSTVTTLWRVADAPTADFMRVFYHHLQRGVSRAEALRRAKLRFITSDSELAHPHFWAAFVLTGDGSRPIPRALTWRVVVATGVVLAAVVVAAARTVRKRRRRLVSHEATEQYS
jgi:CHAT domain-containing protein